MLHYKKGNLLDVKEGIIAHGVNCQGVMGSGVALAIKQKYPIVFDAYRNLSDDYGLADKLQALLGQIQVRGVVPKDVSHPTEPLLLVANLFTQFDYGKEKQRYVDYDAVATCFEKLYEINNRFYNLPLHIPKIGAGLGGGDWNVISVIIESVYKDDVTVWEL
jgi:O-acetyl-ADP-ribose deacetylase (regulator of RNase III)